MGKRMEMEIHAATLPKENEKLTNAGIVWDRGWRWWEGKNGMETRWMEFFLAPFTVCSGYKRKFVVYPFVN
jgi:hypothetical protein